MAHAQQELTLFHMNNLVQASYINPTAMPEFKISIGLPIISSVYTSLGNSSFRLNDLKANLNKSDSTIYNFDKLMSKLDKNKNYLYTHQQVDLFSLRFRHRWWFITLNATQKFDVRFNYTKDFLNLHTGNASYIGNEANFDNVSLNAMNYTEYAIGIMRAKDGSKFRYGVRGKFLMGQDNIYMPDGKKRYSVNGEYYQQQIDADFVINTNSFFNTDSRNYDSTMADKIEKFETDAAQKYFWNNKNTGLAMDLGVTYLLNKRTSFTAALNNLGYINWRSHAVNYKIDGSYNFNGIDVQNLGNSAIELDKIVDTLEKRFEPVRSENSYRTRLYPQLYLSAQYKLGRSTQLSGTFFSEFNQGIRPAISAGLHQRLGRVINLMVSYSALRKSYNNLGIGFLFKPGPFQFYLVSDNVLALANPFNANFFNLRAGMNLVFVKVRNPEAPSHNE
jgi:hypothetical protein